MLTALLNTARFVWILIYSISATVVVYFYELVRGSRSPRDWPKLSATAYYKGSTTKERSLATSPAAVEEAAPRVACASTLSTNLTHSDTHIAARRMQRVQSEDQSSSKVSLTLSTPKVPPVAVLQAPLSPPVSPVSSVRSHSSSTTVQEINVWAMSINEFLIQIGSGLLDRSAIMEFIAIMEQKSEQEQACMATILESKKLNVTAISSLLNKLQRHELDSLDLTALRTVLLVQFTFIQLKRHINVYQLYDGQFPSQSIIKNNLEYLAHHPDYLMGAVPNTADRAVERTACSLMRYMALATGANLARVLSDPGAANYYESCANRLEQVLV